MTTEGIHDPDATGHLGFPFFESEVLWGACNDSAVAFHSFPVQQGVL